jgi:hypothetical protein
VVTVAELDVGSYAEDDPRLFPWSAASLHEETHDDADHDEWPTQCVIDNGGDRFVTETLMERAEARPHGQLRTCANGAGEVDFWRLELNLDDRGRSFLALLDFALRVGIRPIAEFVRSPRAHSNSITFAELSSDVATMLPWHESRLRGDDELAAGRLAAPVGEHNSR